MARQFDGTSQALQSASALALSAYNTLTIAYWFWYDHTDATNYHIIMEAGDGILGGGILDFAYHVGAAAPLAGILNAAGTQYGACQYAAFATGAWTHVVQQYDMTKDESNDSNRKMSAHYINGASITRTSAISNFTATGETFANLAFNFMARSGPNTFTQGNLAEVAIWSTLLSGANISDMYNGGAGGIGRSADFYTTNRLYYWKIGGTTSPEPEALGGIALNLVGSPPSVTGPSIEYPASGTGLSTSLLSIGH